MDAGRHPGIELLICSEVTALEGAPGAFRAHVLCRSVGVIPELCTGCGDCAEVCPVKAPNPCDMGFSTRKAIFRPFPQAVPSAYAVDPDLCLSKPEMVRCEQCVKACPTGAATHNRVPKELVLDVGAVVVATGFEELDPRHLRRYGYASYPNVVTSLELERLLNASGPTLGHVLRPSDEKPPKNVVYVQCVGGRGEDDRPYCSRFCCMNAVKDAMLLKQHDPNLESVTILYMDIRAFGKGFEEFYARARQKDWISFVRGRPAKITETDDGHDLIIHAENTETGKPIQLHADMVVLSCAGTPPAGARELAARLDIELSPMGFFASRPGGSPVRTSREGVYVCGSAIGPQVIPDCVAQGSAAAAEAAILLRDTADDADASPTTVVRETPRAAKTPSASDEAEEGPAWAEEVSPEFDPHTSRDWGAVLDQEGVAGAGRTQGVPASTAADAGTPPVAAMGGEPRIGVFLCDCGINIAGTLTMSQLLEYARTLPGVVHVSEELFACSSTSQSGIQEAILEHGLNRIVVAACTPRTHEPIFRENCRAAGLNPYLLEMVNIRDQCSWVHAAEPEAATEKAMDLLRMATARAKRLSPLTPTLVDVLRKAVVLGGGLAGMKAASDLSALGFRVTLVERSQHLGGLLTQLHSLYPAGEDPGEAIEQMRARMRERGVDLRLGTEVREVTGFVGNFRVRLGPALEDTPDAPSSADEKGEEIETGGIIIAIGAEPYEPAAGEFGFGEFDNVITSVEFERRLRDPEATLGDVGSVAFIQCVGSRVDPADAKACGYPGCSRICCPTTVKQTLEIRRRGVDAICFYRDMRMVSSGAEEMYREARASGAVFLRFDAERPPRVTGDARRAQTVTTYDTLLRAEVRAPVDLVVLAVGLVPRMAEADRIQEILKTPKGPDGFFLERHPELGPVETCVDGVILCGAAQGPKDLPDSLAQASAAAAKAAALLGKGQLLLDPAVCSVDAARCRACGLCVSLCEFQAPSLVDGKAGARVAQINPALCKGCGTCAVWCPTGAIEAQHFTDPQITSMIDSLFCSEGS